MSNLFTHGDLIRTLIFLLNVSPETRVLGHVNFDTWESAAVSQENRNKASRLCTYVKNVYNKSQSERKTFVLVNNKRLSGMRLAMMQITFLCGAKSIFRLFFHFIMANSGCTIYHCKYFIQCIITY